MRTFGAGGESILPNFRKVAKSYINSFLNAKDHVYQLLGSCQNAESGRFREELFRSFLRRILPSALAVDTGFIYGFEQVPTSNQIDIIVWHKAIHSAVYDAGSAVIVPPEAVVSVISIKSKMTLEEIESGVKNLMSVAPLDYRFRSNVRIPGTEIPLPAITKFLVFYSQPDSIKNVLSRISSVVSETVGNAPELSVPIVKAMRECDQFDNRHASFEEARRAFPRLIATIEPGDANFVQGWGPPFNADAQSTFGSGMHRLPWMYRCNSRLTTALEKVVFLLLQSAFQCLASPALSSLSSWGDLDPTTGTCIGSVEETIEDEGVALMTESSLQPPANGDG